MTSSRLAPGAGIVTVPGGRPAVRTAEGEFLHLDTGTADLAALTRHLVGGEAAPDAEVARVAAAFEREGHAVRPGPEEGGALTGRTVLVLGDARLTGPLARYAAAEGARTRHATPEHVGRLADGEGAGASTVVVWCLDEPVPPGLWDAADGLPAHGTAWLRCHREGAHLWTEPLAAAPGDVTSAHVRLRRLAATSAHRQLAAYWAGHRTPTTARTPARPPAPWSPPSSPPTSSPGPRRAPAPGSPRAAGSAASTCATSPSPNTPYCPYLRWPRCPDGGAARHDARDHPPHHPRRRHPRHRPPPPRHAGPPPRRADPHPVRPPRPPGRVARLGGARVRRRRAGRARPARLGGGVAPVPRPRGRGRRGHAGLDTRPAVERRPRGRRRGLVRRVLRPRRRPLPRRPRPGRGDRRRPRPRPRRDGPRTHRTRTPLGPPRLVGGPRRPARLRARRPRLRPRPGPEPARTPAADPDRGPARPPTPVLARAVGGLPAWAPGRPRLRRPAPAARRRRHPRPLRRGHRRPLARLGRPRPAAARPVGPHPHGGDPPRHPGPRRPRGPLRPLGPGRARRRTRSRAARRHRPRGERTLAPPHGHPDPARGA